MSKFITFILLLSILVIGCSDDPVTSNNVDGAYYYRSAGNGTIKLEVYEHSADRIYFKKVQYELTALSLALTIVPNEEIVPLAIDNLWVYEVKVFDSSNAVIYTGVDSTKVDRDTTIDNQLWYILVDRDGPLQLGANLEDGYHSRDVYATGTIIDSIGEAYLSSQYPATLNETYANKTGYETKVMNLDTVVIVPADTFHCVRYFRYEK